MPRFHVVLLFVLVLFSGADRLLQAAPPGSRMQVVSPANVVGRDNHLVVRATQDGAPVGGRVSGEICLQLNPGIGNTGNQRYLYADVEQGFLQNATGAVEAVVSWRGQSMPALEYDSLDRTLPLGGKYKPAFGRDITGASGSWNVASFLLPDPQFYDRMNGPADFRIIAEDPVVLLEISLRRGVPVPLVQPVLPIMKQEVFIRFGADASASALMRLPDSPRTLNAGSETATGLEVGNSAASYAAYVSLAIDDTFWYAASGTAELVAEYHDRGVRCLIVRYDSALASEPYHAAPPLEIRDLGNGWKQAFFSLDHAFFANRQNHAGDLRLGAVGPIILRQVLLRRGIARRISPEKARKILYHLFTRFLRRSPTPREEQLYQRALMNGGLSPRELIRKLTYSQEYQERFFHSIRFEKAVNQLAWRVLERRLTLDEQVALAGPYGERRFDQVVDALLDSSEYRTIRGEYGIPGLD